MHKKHRTVEKMFTKIIVFVTVFIQLNSGQYEVPDATVEILQPRGFKVSIPDEEGIKLFAFHGKINDEFEGREAGTFARDIIKAKNGKWTFHETYTKLKPGDVLYYWTFVDFFDGRVKLGYVRDDQKFQVSAASLMNTENCKISSTKIGNYNHNLLKICSGQLIFSEDFNSIHQQLNETIWKRELRFAGAPDYEFVMYTDRSETLQLVNDQLRIQPIPTDELFGDGFVSSRTEYNFGSKCTGKWNTLECVQESTGYLILPPVSSAQISTKDKFSFRYGRVEMRAKLPFGNWIYPELFLNPESETYGSDYASGQIRIAFTFGNAAFAKDLYGGCVFDGHYQDLRRKFGIKHTNLKWHADFHLFGIVWNEDRISVSVDGKVYGTISPMNSGFVSMEQLQQFSYASKWHQGTKMAPFDQNMYLVVGIGVGGHLFTSEQHANKPWHNNDPKEQKTFYRAAAEWRTTWTPTDSALLVDYIRIWAL